MQCELSGEPVATAAAGSIVVTPSGHVCRKDLLLTKLTENGGVDPFSPERPLTEDELIVLAQTNNNNTTRETKIPPRPLQATSFPSLLTAVASEYDAVVLELFDTRQALQDCRQELSQALYQNDAALRVIARLSAERDAARQQLQEWEATNSGTGTTAPKKRKRSHVLEEVLQNDLPADDQQAMIQVWEELHSGRKALMKKLGASAPDAATVKQALAATTTPNRWSDDNAASSASVVAISEHQWAAAATNNVKVYQASKEIASFKSTEQATALDVSDDWLVWGDATGNIQMAKLDSGSDGKVASVNIESSIASLSLHPDKQHALVATAEGHVCVLQLASAQVVAVFPSPGVTYTSGSLHPDGLIYVEIGRAHV